jgi:16S rRNA (cytosine1402-N4)-methyltransferase
MAVNGELDEAQAGIEAALRLVKVTGRVAVISFHSIEDRAVKQLFAKHEGRWESLQAGGRAWRGEEPAVQRITRKPVEPSDAEVQENPRARSAKLRVVERIR